MLGAAVRPFPGPVGRVSLVGVAGAGLGMVVILATWGSVLSVLVVPRRSRDRLSRLVNAITDGVFRVATSRVRGYASRDRLLAGQAATLILLQLATWLVLFYLGFALVLQLFDAHGTAHAFAQAGSSLFTLGYTGPDTAELSVIDYLAAATGLIVVALQIGYLPTLYSAFNRRETEVTLLSSRAGTPAWGPEILARTRYGFTSADDGAVMDRFYLQWERWAADLSESHSNYPVLMRFRSPAKLASWLVALVAVLDSAALWLALSPDRAPTTEARLALRMGFSALRSLAATIGIPVEHDPDPDSDLQLSYDGLPCRHPAHRLNHLRHGPQPRTSVAGLSRMADQLRGRRVRPRRPFRRRARPVDRPTPHRRSDHATHPAGQPHTDPSPSRPAHPHPDTP